MQPNYGARAGLADRLEEWKHRFGTDRSLPWPGLGLLADLQAAADALNGKPEKNWLDPKPGEAKLEFDEPEAWEIEATQAMEFDL